MTLISTVTVTLDFVFRSSSNLPLKIFLSQHKTKHTREHLEPVRTFLNLLSLSLSFSFSLTQSLHSLFSLTTNTRVELRKGKVSFSQTRIHLTFAISRESEVSGMAEKVKEKEEEQATDKSSKSEKQK